MTEREFVIRLRRSRSAAQDTLAAATLAALKIAPAFVPVAAAAPPAPKGGKDGKDGKDGVTKTVVLHAGGGGGPGPAGAPGPSVPTRVLANATFAVPAYTQILFRRAIALEAGASIVLATDSSLIGV